MRYLLLLVFAAGCKMSDPAHDKMQFLNQKGFTILERSGDIYTVYKNGIKAQVKVDDHLFMIFQ